MSFLLSATLQSYGISQLSLFETAYFYLKDHLRVAS